jgi:DNA repair exonuclease SbcCD nuclease subunit
MVKKIGVIGDLHMRDRLRYADLVKDGREEERRLVLDCIVEKTSDCDAIVFLGDQFHSKNPTSKTISMFTAFLERFGNKEIYLLVGNHEIDGDLVSSMDYMMELKNKKWNVIKEITSLDGMCFLPWIPKNTFETRDHGAMIEEIMQKISSNNLLFAHYAVSGCEIGGPTVETFNEPVLPMDELQKRFKMVFTGHIHTPKRFGSIVLCGSVFTADAGEKEKNIYILDTSTLAVETIQLPCRPILNVVDAEIPPINSKAILKIEIRDPSICIEDIKRLTSGFDGVKITKNIQSERERLVDTSNGIPELDEKNLLETYAKVKKVDLVDLMMGYDLVKGV